MRCVAGRDYDCVEVLVERVEVVDLVEGEGVEGFRPVEGQED